MKYFLIISVKYNNEEPYQVLDKIVELFDKKKEVDLTSDDYVTRFPETTNGKSIAININYDSKDFKTAVFEILVKANSLGSGWKVKGPVKVKKNMFILNLDKGFADNLPQGVNGFSIVLNNTE